MKKVAFTLILVITFTFIYNYLPVSATSTTLPSDFVNFNDLIGFEDLGYALIGGAQFDFNDSKYVIEDYSSLSAAGKLEAERQKIKEFLQDYEAARNIEYGFTESSLYQGQSYYTTAFTSNANQIQEQYSISSQNVDWAMGISPFKYADWAHYNRFWIDRYSDSFESSQDQPITPNPDSSYISDINYINLQDNTNTSAFWFYANPQSCDLPGNSRFYFNLEYYPITNYSFYVYNANLGFNSSWASPPLAICNPLNINIVSSDDHYVTSFTCNYLSDAVLRYDRNTGNYIPYNGVQFSGTTNFSGTENVSSRSFTFTGSLSEIFAQLKLNFKNVNIYVNGDPWAIIGNPAPANPVIPDFPDVIQDEDNLAYDIPFPNTSNYEGSFDITSVFDALREAIIGASDSDSTTTGTLTGEKVIDTYDGVDIDTQDKVVDLVSTKVFTGTLEDTTTDRLPDIPIPPIGVHNGLAGATVLAKYIDATQCILPEEVITVFWGGFFILIILGLIKSLHR